MRGIPEAEMSFGHIKIGTYLPLDKTSPQPESVYLRLCGVCPLWRGYRGSGLHHRAGGALAVIYRYLLMRLCTPTANARPNPSHGIRRSESISPVSGYSRHHRPVGRGADIAGAAAQQPKH